MTSKKKTLSVKERIRRGGTPTRTVPVWLGADLDLLDEYERLQAEKPAAVVTSLAGGSTNEVPTSDRLAELRELLGEYLVEFRLRGLAAKPWGKLAAAHPPRTEPDGSILKADRVLGANMETFPAALVRAATVSPELDDEDWLALFGDDNTDGQLTPGQLDALSAAAYGLSKHDADVPFWSAGSSTSRPTASA